MSNAQEVLNERMFKLLDKFCSDALSEEQRKAMLIESAEEISSIAEESRKSPLFQKAKERYEEFKADFKNKEPKEAAYLAWNFMVERIAIAPTYIHGVASVRLLMPLVDEFLKMSLAPSQPGGENG